MQKNYAACRPHLVQRLLQASVALTAALAYATFSYFKNDLFGCLESILQVTICMKMFDLTFGGTW